MLVDLPERKLDEKGAIIVGKLIIFEGIDGSGKSTQIEMLRNFLELKKQKVIVTREPGGTEFGERCRKLFMVEELDGLTEACLAFASRNEHILQKIILPSGHLAGTILFESKSTKNWSNKWVEKLRSDMQESSAAVSLLVSKAFPAKETEALIQLEERIWLCKPGPHVVAFVKALRQGIIMEARQRTLEEFTSSSSKDALFEYITGDFVEQISNIGRVYSDLSTEMTKEKNAFKRKWAAREKLLEQLANSMTGVVGSISGIGVPTIKLEKIKELEL